MTNSLISLSEQISELRREMALRKNVYPRFVGSRKLTQAKADKQFDRLAAAIATLEGLERQRAERAAADETWQ